MISSFARKEQIRNAARAYRTGLTEKQLKDISAAVTEKLLTSSFYATANTILSYAAIINNREIDTGIINQTILAQNKKLVLPRIGPDTKSLQLIRTLDLKTLEKNYFKIPEPVGNLFVNLNCIDLILVPMLAGDQHLNRVGYGLGYYDIMLSQFQGVTCGLLCDACLFDYIPAGKHDQALDIIITEKRIIQRKV